PLLGATYIYSPRAQRVPVSLWWGSFYLNGEGPLAHTPEPDAWRRRYVTQFDLKEGWNFLFVRAPGLWSSWEQMISWPKGAGLVFSPNKRRDDPDVFLTAGPFRRDEEEQVNRLALRHPRDLPKKLSAQWQPQPHRTTSADPAVDIAWRAYGERHDTPGYRTQGLTVNDPAGSALVYDVGQKTLGRIFVEVDAPAGTMLDISWTEDLAPDSSDRPWFFKRTMVNAGTRFVSDGRPRRFETFRPYGLRFLQLNVRNNEGPVTVRKVGVVEQLYPFEREGSFECSDPLLNRIWMLGWRTVRVCAEDAYTDTPFRERGLYAGDMLPEVAITLAGTDDLRLAARCLRLFRDKYKHEYRYEKSTPHNDYLFFPIVTLEWYLDRTAGQPENDLETARVLYDSYETLFAETMKRRRESDGLIDVGRSFVEWTKIDKEAELTTLHVLIARSLRSMSRVAERLDKPADARRYAQQADELTAYIQTKFWDEAKGAYRDGFNADGTPIDNHYAISSAWAVLFDVATPAQTERILDHLEAELEDIGEEARNRKVTPYGGFYVLGALYKHGRPDVAERFVRKYWARMIDYLDDTAWENFSSGIDGGGTLSHAWSGGPTYYLTTQTLGVDLGFPTPAAPDEVLIAPQAEGIDWARGTVPHPQGAVEVDWRVAGDVLFLDYTAPEGVRVRVAPRGRLAEKQLWVNGERAE
ncbi:MAG: alpha-L-rhamnosidase C-terminal domain-containing protein, partial [Catalinimonas sp.]